MKFISGAVNLSVAALSIAFASLAAEVVGSHSAPSKLSPQPRRVQISLAREIWAYMRVRKKWWLFPIVVVMFVVGALLMLAQGSALAPFIYTIF